jgi:hypothetical protein
VHQQVQCLGSNRRPSGSTLAPATVLTPRVLPALAHAQGGYRTMPFNAMHRAQPPASKRLEIKAPGAGRGPVAVPAGPGSS